jgi:hypothetical protein
VCWLNATSSPRTGTPMRRRATKGRPATGSEPRPGGALPYAGEGRAAKLPVSMDGTLSG